MDAAVCFSLALLHGWLGVPSPGHAISGMQTPSCVLRPLGFHLRLPCLPITRTPSQVKAVDTGQLTRDRLPSVHTEGLGKVTRNNQERRRQSRLEGSQQRGDMHARRTHPCASGQSPWLRGARGMQEPWEQTSILWMPLARPSFLPLLQATVKRSQSPPQHCTIYSEFISAF